ncbi:hypothetical protein M2368_003620 [Arthrobacter sp. JUb119]|nr:hypothetical protein [Arthrobacter sp. JUb119]
MKKFSPLLGALIGFSAGYYIWLELFQAFETSIGQSMLTILLGSTEFVTLLAVGATALILGLTFAAAASAKMLVLVFEKMKKSNSTVH